MKLSEVVKPVSYLQDYAPEIIHQLAEGQQTLVMTEDNEICSRSIATSPYLMLLSMLKLCCENWKKHI